MSDTSAGRIKALDGWRGLSISLVVLGHVGGARYGLPIEPVATAVALLGVKLFFCISGFIITKLALEEIEQSGRFSVSRFYMRRAFRILPPLTAYLCILFLASSAGWIDQPRRGLLYSALFLCNSLECGWFAGHTWSLAFEEQFYLTFPIVMALPGRRQIIAGLAVALMAFPFLRTALGLEGGWSAIPPFASSFVFIAAGAVGAAYEKQVRSLATGHYGNTITYCSVATILAILLVESVPAGPGSWLSHIQPALNLTLLVIACAWAVCSAPCQKNGIMSLLNTTPLLFLGGVSYSLYLWQQLFTGRQAVYFVSQSWFAWPLMFGAAMLCAYCIERPSLGARRAMERRLQCRRETTALFAAVPGTRRYEHDGQPTY